MHRSEDLAPGPIFVPCPVQLVATACLYLAGKVVDTPKSARDVFCACFERRFRAHPDLIHAHLTSRVRIGAGTAVRCWARHGAALESGGRVGLTPRRRPRPMQKCGAALLVPAV